MKSKNMWMLGKRMICRLKNMCKIRKAPTTGKMAISYVRLVTLHMAARPRLTGG